jgi:hypothetical protein
VFAQRVQVNRRTSERDMQDNKQSSTRTIDKLSKYNGASKIRWQNRNMIEVHQQDMKDNKQCSQRQT